MKSSTHCGNSGFILSSNSILLDLSKSVDISRNGDELFVCIAPYIAAPSCPLVLLSLRYSLCFSSTSSYAY